MNENHRQFLINNLLQLLVTSAHIIIIWTIRRAKLRDNRYFLLQTLSTFDVIYSLVTVVGTIPHAFMSEGGEQRHVMLFWITVLSATMHLMSLQTTILISVDRFMAVKNSLRYYALVTKQRCVYIIAVTFLLILSTNTSLMMLSTLREDWIFITTYGLLAFMTIFRTTTCVVILITGAVALRIRSISVNRLDHTPFLVVLHGVNAEKLTSLRALKRSIKDVMVLNFCTVAFLIPITIVSGLGAFSRAPNGLSGKSGFMLTAVNSLPNPIVYIFTQQEISKWLKTRLKILLVGPTKVAPILVSKQSYSSPMDACITCTKTSVC